MLFKSTKDAGFRTRYRDARALPTDQRKIVLLGALLSIVLFCTIISIAKRSEAAENDKCGETLKQLSDAGFKDNSTTSTGNDTCTPDIRGYIDFVVFVLSSEDSRTTKELEAGLLTSAESGYLGARIQYTLLFTNIYGGKFSADMLKMQTYSRYVPYIISFYEFDRWRQEHNAGDLDLVNLFANTALSQGVLES